MLPFRGSIREYADHETWVPVRTRGRYSEWQLRPATEIHSTVVLGKYLAGLSNPRDGGLPDSTYPWHGPSSQHGLSDDWWRIRSGFGAARTVDWSLHDFCGISRRSDRDCPHFFHRAGSRCCLWKPGAL